MLAGTYLGGWLIINDNVKSFKDTINAKKFFLSKKMLFLFNFGGDLLWWILMKLVPAKISTLKVDLLIRRGCTFVSPLMTTNSECLKNAI